MSVIIAGLDMVELLSLYVQCLSHSLSILLIPNAYWNVADVPVHKRCVWRGCVVDNRCVATTGARSRLTGLRFNLPS